MSNTGKIDLAYPRSQQFEQGSFADRTIGIAILNFFGGTGGPADPYVTGVTQYVYSVKVPKFVVRNKSLTLRNPEFFGVDIFSDAGPDIMCDHSFDTRQPWWLGLSANGVLTDAEVKAQGNMFNQALPYDIEILENKLPQPIDADWSNRIYIHMVWDSALYINGGEIKDNILEIAKYDYDIKI